MVPETVLALCFVKDVQSSMGSICPGLGRSSQMHPWAESMNINALILCMWQQLCPNSRVVWGGGRVVGSRGAPLFGSLAL